jgi:hypothetical protein
MMLWKLMKHGLFGRRNVYDFTDLEGKSYVWEPKDHSV